MQTSFARICAVAATLCALASAPAQAEIQILGSRGGQVGPFLDLFEKVRASGERVVIDGPCLSACTLVLSMVPHDRICVTRRAVLGFHAARSMDRRGRMYAEPEASAISAPDLSVRCTQLDYATRRVDLAPAAVARPRTRRILSNLPLTGPPELLHPFQRRVHHPGNTELVDAHAEAFGEEGLAKGHVEAAALRQRIELAFCFGGIVDRQRD